MSTKIADVIVPEVFVPYTIQRTAELSALVQSGIVVPDPAIDTLAQKGGTLIQMPFFNDLTGDDEVLSDLNPLTVGKIGTGKDVARLFARGKAWGVNDLSKALSGDDPMGAIADLVAAYWNRREQALLVSLLNGVFAANASANASDLIANFAIETATVDPDNLIGGDAVVDAAFKLGDAQSGLTAIMMHNKPYSRLVKNDLIEFEKDSTGTFDIPYFMGKRVIVDDGCPVVAGATSGFKYTSYLFGTGAVGRGEGNAPVPVETDRDSLAGEDILINRRHFVLHPRGIKWNEAVCAGVSPSNAECENAANWTRVYDKKNIRIVQLVTNG